jgi:hypothetical protein
MDDANSDGGPVHNGIKYCGIVPYIGIFQSDFTFLDEGSPTFLSPGETPLSNLSLLCPRRAASGRGHAARPHIFKFRARQLEKS